MPADVNKTIEISMTADLKSLQKQLSKIPGMTKEEAQAMTKALQRELRQAQAAAKKTAQVNKTAMKQVKQSTDAAARSAKNLRIQARQMSSAFGAMEEVVGEVSPELASLAMTIGTVGSAFRILARSLATGNPYVLALVAAVTAAAAIYSVLTSGMKAAEEQQKRLIKATEQLTEKMKNQRDLAKAVITDNRNASTELAVFTGQMTQLEADIRSIRDDAEEKLLKQLSTQDNYIKQQKQSIALVEKAKKAYGDLTDEEHEQLLLVMAGSKHRFINQGMLSTSAGFSLQIRKLAAELNMQLEKETNFRHKIRETNEETTEKQIELLKLQDEMKKEQEEEEKRQERIALAREAAAERQRQLSDAYNQTLSAREQSEKRIVDFVISRLNEEDQLNANAQKRKDEIEAEKKALFAQYEAMSQLAKTEKDRAKLKELEAETIEATAALTQEQYNVEELRIIELAELKKKLADEQQKIEEKLQKEKEQKDKEALNQYIALQKVRIQAVTDIFAFGLQLATESGNKNKDLINVLFRANQAASLANIAMSTAEAIAAAPAQYGPLAPLAIPAIVASGAVQAGVVLAQKPPLHMGGMVQPLAPDEQQRTLLTGESVLDRATTRRLGENGIRDLQNGKSMSNVIVMNPFKHLDRYNRSALRNQNSAFAQLQPTKRSRY